MLTICRSAKRRVDGSVGFDESVRSRLRWNIAATALTRVAAVLLASGLFLVLSTWSESGGISDTIPADWVAVTPGPGAEIVQFIKELPHDPNPLGLRAAHQRTKVPPGTFRAVRFSSVDGTPLGGMLGLSFSSDAMPRPGVVLVPGFTQTTHQKYIVELADLFQRNGWHVLTVDLRGHGVSRTLSPALITGGWKEAGDVLGAVRFLRGVSPAITSVAVIGFSDGGRSLVKAMGGDGGGDIAAGVAVTAALGPTTPETPPTPGTATPLNDFFRTFLGTSSTYEYYDRAARSYGVDVRTMEARTVADTDVVHVKAPLLLLYALDDFFWLAKLKNGQQDGGSMSLAYRDRVASQPNVRTVVVDRGNHAGMLYLSDPSWFGLTVMNYFKYWQARDKDYVTTAVPPLDILAEGTLAGETATYRLLVRNHGPVALGPMDLSIDLPAGARLRHCWLGVEGLGRCNVDGSRLTWTLPKLAGGKATGGPFGAAIDVSTLKPGRFEITAWIDQPTNQLATTRQEVWLEKK